MVDKLIALTSESVISLSKSLNHWLNKAKGLLKSLNLKLVFFE